MALILAAVHSGLLGQSEPFKTGRGLFKYDRGELEVTAGWKDPGTGSIPASRWVEYDFEVPSDGWYGLYFQDLPNLAREIMVDGERVALALGESPKSAAELLGVPLQTMTQGGWTKGANLPLKAGKHTMRLQRIGRMGFPAGMPRAWEVRAAGTTPADRIQARVAGYRELRKGEPLKLSLIGGFGPAATYEIFRIDELNSRSERVAWVEFPESKKFITRTVEIPSTNEGVFQVHAKAGNRLLTPAEFIESSYFVVDTRTYPGSGGRDAKMDLLYDVDCVANTINGKPVEAGANYWEANGATRVSETVAGRYRESNNGLGPGTDPHPKNIATNFSGFAYLFEIPDAGKPYQIEIDHPDDDWRSVCVSVADIFDKANRKGYLPPTFAYETGGYLPLSNSMLTEKFMFWPNGKEINVGLVSSRTGKRAAAAHIRVFEVQGRLPAQTKGSDGRFVGLYMEEMKRWHTHFNTAKSLPPAVRDYIGLNRTMEWAAYTGVNAFWPTATAYQEATYDAREAGGFLLQAYNVPRLAALLGEKYHLGFVAEIFLAKQNYFNEKTMTEGAETPKDLYTASWWGYRACDSRSSGGILPSWNILHPHVQKKMIAVYGELADTLGDTKSFLGMSGRLDAWQWDGLFALSSLNWGYEDWTIHQFEKDTGISVPGEATDPQRYEKRYRYLTSSGMKEKWVAWRKGRVTDFLLRLSARIRQAKSSATLFLVGNAATDESHRPSVSPRLSERLEGMGIDLAVLAKEPGVSIMPAGSFGRGKTRTYLTDQEAYDVFMDPDYIAAGKGRVRSFAEFGSYQEWGDEFPLAKLGNPLERWWYTTGSDAAGRNALERFSTVLAEQDTMAIRDGGYPLLYGRRAFFSEWMAEFSQLPRLPFDPVPFARDPVAVWQRTGQSELLFYVVNREQYPVAISLKLKAATEVTRLGNQESVKLKEGWLALDLKPYELRAFRAPQVAALIGAEVVVPPERIEFVRGRLAYAQDLAAKMESGIFSSSFSDTEKAEFRKHLDEAWGAFQSKSYWRARTLLASAPMMAICEKFGDYPTGQVLAQFTKVLADVPTDRFDPGEPFTDAAALFAALVPGSGAELVDSQTFNSEWRYAQVVRSGKAGLDFDLDVPAAGLYRLSLGYVAEKPGVMAVTLNNQSLPLPLVVRNPGEPEKAVFPQTLLPAGKIRLSVNRPDAFGIYALKLVPVLKPLPTMLWSTAGPFKSFWTTGLPGAKGNEALKAGADQVYPPQKDPAISAVYQNESGREIRWEQTKEIVGSHEESGVNFSQRSGITGMDFGFAQTFIESPKDQEVLFYLGTDWWANAYLNGELLKPEGKREEQLATGFEFNGWKPKPVKVRLKKGTNTLLVKNQGGTLNCWFTSSLTDPGDLRISAVPKSQ